MLDLPLPLDRDEVSIYGIYLGTVFGFTLRPVPRATYSGPIWEIPHWRYSKEIDKDDPDWQRVRELVYKNEGGLIQYWDSHYDEIIKRFDRRYDGWF
jgi:hypothetical protein